MGDKHTWDFGHNADSGVRFDFTKSFDEQVKKLKSIKGGRMRIGSDNYCVLLALFNGNTVDDYGQKITDINGNTIHNIRTMVSTLKNHWNICIGSRKKGKGTQKEYILKGRE